MPSSKVKFIDAIPEPSLVQLKVHQPGDWSPTIIGRTLKTLLNDLGHLVGTLNTKSLKAETKTEVAKSIAELATKINSITEKLDVSIRMAIIAGLSRVQQGEIMGHPALLTDQEPSTVKLIRMTSTRRRKSHVNKNGVSKGAKR